MKAIRYHRAGGVEVLEHVDAPDPTPDHRDVVVRVEACALNRLDVVQRNGWYQMPGFTYPHIPGMDVAGTIVDVGDAVTEVMVGWLTVAHGLFETGALRRGETVLIHAAGAGVSVAAIQLAKHAGATVLATAGSDEKCGRALELGADHVVNNRVGDVANWARGLTDGVGVDLVFDHVGAALFGPSLLALGIHGRLISSGNTSGDTATIPSLGYLFHCGIRILGSDPYRPEEFGPLWQLYCEQRFEAIIHAEYPLEEAADAQRTLEGSDVFGKIVLRP